MNSRYKVKITSIQQTLQMYDYKFFPICLSSYCQTGGRYLTMSKQLCMRLSLPDVFSLDRLISSSCNSSQRWASCCEMESVTALTYHATFSDVTDTLGDVSISWSDILLGVFFFIKIPVSVPLAMSSVSTPMVLFVDRKPGWGSYLDR